MASLQLEYTMRMFAQIILFRHGAYIFDKERGFVGNACPLSEEGKKQIELATEAVIEKIGRPDIVYHSPILRAKESGVIMAALGEARTVIEDDRLAFDAVTVPLGKVDLALDALGAAREGLGRGKTDPMFVGETMAWAENQKTDLPAVRYWPEAQAHIRRTVIELARETVNNKGQLAFGTSHAPFCNLGVFDTDNTIPVSAGAADGFIYTVNVIDGTIEKTEYLPAPAFGDAAKH